MLTIPTDLKSKLVFKSTKDDVSRGTALITGGPRCGKTLLAYLLAKYVAGDDVFLVDLPEEEGTETLRDWDIPYTTVTSIGLMDELYNLLYSRIKPRGIVWDGLGASYAMIQNEKVPSGEMPEDRGKTWNLLATALRKQIVRFKTLPSVEFFVATSLVWGDKDEITGTENRLQVVLPGQLKSNIYGLFSYNLNISVQDSPSGTVRVLECQPTARTVAGVRAPLSRPVKPRLPYDLAKPERGVEYLAKELGLRINQPAGKEESK
jgi:hypothetical protein